MQGKIVCNRCRFFYTTWEPAHPYGCRAHGFKSPRPPSEIVRQASGQDCLSYEPRTPKEKAEQ